MPKETFDKDYRFLPRSELLTFEEIEQVVRAAAELGVTKVRLPVVSHWCAGIWSD